MKLNLVVFLGLLFVCNSCSCGQAGKNDETKANKITTTVRSEFSLPEIPLSICSPNERARFLIAHYWDRYDFSDTVLLKNEDITEQAFVNYITLFPHTEIPTIEQSITAMLDKASLSQSVSFDHFVELYEKYLSDPNSPFRQPEYYIPVLRYIISNDKIAETDKVRPRYQLNIALKNRIGEIASDFTFTSPEGEKRSLTKVKSDFVMLFFNNPDCHDCLRVKELLSQSSIPGVQIVAIYVDEQIESWKNTRYPATWINGYAPTLRSEQIYDLRAIPTLYLLDHEKRIILKDASVEQIFQYMNDTIRKE